MDYRSEEMDIAVNPQVLVDLVRDAYEFFAENKVEERYRFLAMDLIRRYVSREGLPREADPLFGAALFIVIRHAWSHPNPLTKTDFAAKMRMKESSLEWYTESIVDKIGFETLHDKNHLPFYVDPQGTIARVIDSVVRGNVGEEVVRSIVRGNMVSAHSLAEKIVDQLCRVVKIVPAAFEQGLLKLVKRMIEEESRRLLTELEGRK
ncbi:MAG: hypothetical protein JSW61_04960 [Candidatus Thorarchaeota archaeon]|nr:MAG: hypothetical protein JSW61_04960 [Candidatus Thorarchaeota archaeon]